MAIKGYISDLGGRLKGALASGPLEIALSVMAWLAYIWGVQSDSDGAWELVARATFIAGISLPVVYALSFSHKRGGIGLGVRSALSAGMVLFAVVASFFVDWGTSLSPIQVSASVLASLAAMTAIPRQFKMPYAEYHRFITTFTARFGTTFFVCFILAGGISLALAALDVILGINFSSEPYLHVWGMAAIVVFPALIVGDIPELVQDVADTRALPEGNSGFRAIRFVFIPLVFVYLALAALYLFTRMRAGDHEIEVLNIIILGAALLAWIGQDIYAKKIEENADFFARFLRIFAWVLVPMLLITFILTRLEIAADGFSEEFYLVQVAVLVGLGAFISTIVQYLKGGGPSLVGPRLALVIGGLLVAWGGPFSYAAMRYTSASGNVIRDAKAAGVISADGTCMSAEQFKELTEQVRPLPWDDATASSVRALNSVAWRIETEGQKKKLAREMGCDLTLVQAMIEYEPYSSPVEQLPEYQWHTVMSSDGTARFANLPAGDFVQFRAYPPGEETYEGTVDLGANRLMSRIDPKTYEIFFLLNEREIHRQSLAEAFRALDSRFKEELAPHVDEGLENIPWHEMKIQKENLRFESQGVVVVLESITLQISALGGRDPVPSIVAGAVVFPRSMNVFGDAMDEPASTQNEEPALDAPVVE